jgi:hypothetical protein
MVTIRGLWRVTFVAATARIGHGDWMGSNERTTRVGDPTRGRERTSS